MHWAVGDVLVEVKEEITQRDAEKYFAKLRELAGIGKGEVDRRSSPERNGDYSRAGIEAGILKMTRGDIQLGPGQVGDLPPKYVLHIALEIDKLWADLFTIDDPN